MKCNEPHENVITVDFGDRNNTTERPRYVRARSDFWTHRTTEWMRAIHRDLCLFAAKCNYMGMLEYPIRRISVETNESESDLAEALHELCAHGNFKYYPDLCLWWSVKAAKQNLDGRSWLACSRDVSKLPREIAKDFLAEYKRELFSAPNPKSDGVSVPVSVSVSVPVSVKRKRKGNIGRKKRKSGWPDDAATVLREFNVARRTLGFAADVRETDGNLALITRPLDQGNTVDDWLRVIEQKKRECAETGNTKFFRLSTLCRTGVGGGGKPGVGNFERALESSESASSATARPRTAADAEAWSVAHPGESIPGWKRLANGSWWRPA